MALQDRIGRDDIVNKIHGLVNSLKKDEHFCLAINGAWGSGKSFVLGLLEEKFATMPEYIVVKYDAWENTFYSEPLIAIFSCLIDGLENRLSKFKGYARVCAQAVGKKGKEFLTALSGTGGKIGAFATIVKEIIDIIPQLKKATLLEDTKDGQLSCFKSYKALITTAIELLNKVTNKKWIDGKQTKLVVLVDEIDRCLPDEQLKILERLHHLFSVKNCAVIVAINQSCVAKTVKTIYGIDGYEYLHKFFDFTFKLEMSSEKYLKNLFDGFISSCDKLHLSANEIGIAVDSAYQCLLYGNTNTIKLVNNRELTRYYEAVQNVCNDFGWQKLNQNYVFFIFVALYIRRTISPVFLDVNEIREKQEETNLALENAGYPEYIMPYHDYIRELFGIDRTRLPQDIIIKYGRGQSSFAQLVYTFNETINYSMGGQFPYNELRRFHHQPTVDTNDCKELVRLVILYSGEQEQCEK